ncbi:hypothetical protein NEOLEDRAFT_624092 [Neolentinus lepideus HHB14362 ss-1]|uniref:Uncharacterized protein n=1 Tax=Neolentinus lepideus HHB14362 ss-1 TaxID=1314782 RepID=A0A165QTZ1_9AGAM|nr:hypothetical protein NEOLEDRAFT_624092 [Neolentinus lepideus HHB14362 ss-1]
MDLPFPDITEDDLEFLELNTFDFDSTGGDQLWRPRRLAFMFNTVASACNGSPDLTVSTWLRLVEGEEREDIMGLWVDCDEELPWGPLEWGPLQAHWKAAQDALRARWSRVSAAGYELKLTEKAERIRAVEDPCLRAAAISWLILTSRAMEEADAEQGLRKRTVFRLEELIRIWWSLSRHLTPSSMPTMPQSALDDFVETMNAAGHTCHRALDAHICCWLPFIGWLEGISDFTAVTLGSLECKGCARSLSSHDVAEYNEANATLRANVNHPLQHGSVWPAFLVAVLSDGQIDPLSSYYSFARQHLFELLECVIAMMSIRISAPAWETLDVVLRQSLIVDQPDPAFLEWVNQYPSSWRSSLTLLSRREWQAIHDMREKYSQNPTAPSDRSRLQLLQKIYFPASAGLLEVAISSVLWLATDYKFSKNVFGLFPGWLRMVHDWTEACDAVGRVFFNLPDRGSVQSIALLLQFMEQRGHLCCTIEDGRVREIVYLWLSPFSSRRGARVSAQSPIQLGSFLCTLAIRFV